MAAKRVDLLAALAPLTRALRQVEDDAAARADLTMWQYAILAVVADAAGQNQNEVASTLGYSANRIVADLDLLEQRKLLTRRPGPDRRANVLSTTAAGRRIMARVQADIHRHEDDLLAAWPPGRSSDLLSALGTIRVALRARPGQ